MADNQYDSYDLETGEFIPAAPTPQSRFDDFSSALKNYGASAGLGVADSLWNTGKSVGNLVLDPLSNITGRDLRLSRSEISNQLMPQGGSETARDIGDFAGNFIPIGLGFQALGMVPRIGRALNNVGGSILKGAGLGYALGEDNPIGGREGAAKIGAALGPLSRIQEITDRGIGNRIVNDFRTLKRDFSREYNSIFREAESRGISSVRNPISDSMVNAITNSAPSKVSRGLRNFQNNPTLSNAHQMQSDLGSYISKYQDRHGLTSIERRALRAAEQARDDLRFSINQSLERGGLTLRGRYQDVGQRYREEVVPYIENPWIRKAALRPGAKGYINPKRLTEKLGNQSSDAFMEIMGARYPGYPINRLLSKNKYIGPALSGAGAATAGLYGYNKLIDALSNR